jgi:hypothetical protein
MREETMTRKWRFGRPNIMEIGTKRRHQLQK